LPTLRALKAAKAQTKVVLGLRDILDAPQVVEERWRTEGAYDAVEEFYDLVLIYGMRELFDLAEHYGFSPAMRARSRYCGYVCPAPADRRRQPVRAGLNGHRDAQLIVVMAGGGADAYPMMRATLDALPLLQHQHLYCVIITGPFMPPDLQQDLQTRAATLPAQVLTAVEDTYSYLEEADLVIAMAGYNTTVEILQSGKRAILVPRRGPSAEQQMRAKLFAAKGWVAMLDPDELYPPHFAELIATTLAQRGQPTTPIAPDLAGLDNSAEHLLALLRA
jgi:predicted glycosyltransferase